MPSTRLMVRHAVVSLAFVAIYLLLNSPSVIFISRMGFVAWYPAVGLVMALLLGVSPWYALLACFADVFGARLIYSQPVISFGTTVGAVGGAFCYGLAAYVLRGPLKIDICLGRRQDLVRYIFVTATASAGATVFGVASLVWDRNITLEDYSSSAIGWFLGDAVAIVGVAPFLLVHVFPYLRRWLSPTPSQSSRSEGHSNEESLRLGALTEMCGQVFAIVAVCWAMFGVHDKRYGSLYMCFVPVIWIAMRQGMRRVVTGLLALNFGIVLAMQVFPPTPDTLTRVVVLMLVVSVVGLMVGSEVSERHRQALDLNRQTVYLDALIQNSPLGIVVLDRQEAVQLSNPAFSRLFQYDEHELASIDIAGISGLGEEAADFRKLIPDIFAGNATHKTLRYRRKDGQILNLAFHGVPLLVKGAVRGAYLIYEDITAQTRASEAQRQHTEVLGRLVKELELRTRQMTTLNEMGSLLASSGTIQEAGTVVAKGVQELFPGAVSGGLYLFRSSRDLIEQIASWGKKELLSARFLPDACWSLRRGQPHWSESSGGGVVCQHVAKNATAEYLCVPMIAQGNTLGVLHLEFARAAKLEAEFDEESSQESLQRLANHAASQIALSLASLQLRETLREQSIRDPLTRLFNRRFLEESFERELQLAKRRKQSIAVLFLDLDHFKRFNDTFGHDAGDMVLQALADLFRNFFRTTDICCRYGGEEFAIILLESFSRDAATRSNALCAEVRKLRLQYKNEPLGKLTLSVGIAAFPEHGSTVEELLKIADHCLYESKNRGRDLVTVPLPQKV